MAFRALMALGIAAMLEAGCTDGFVREAQGSCAAYGFRPGTELYARCVQTEARQKEAAFNRDMDRLQRFGVMLYESGR